MMFTRRRSLAVIAVSAAAGLSPVVHARARRLTVLVGFPPGGAPDTVARAVASALKSQDIGTVVVENKAGAGGRMAMDALLAAPADGTTVLLSPAGLLTLYPHVYRKLRYDPMKDFTPVAAACEFQFGFAVGPAVPATVRTAADFMAWARDHPDRAQFGTPGAGTAMHFIAMEMARLGGAPLQHVPYRGGAPALTDTMGGTVAAVFSTLPLLIPSHKAGKVRILATSGERRAAVVPEVPTLAESGYPSLSLSEMFVFVVAASMPASVQEELAQALNAAADGAAVRSALTAANFDPLVQRQDVLSARLKSEHERWRAVVAASGFQSEQ